MKRAANDTMNSSAASIWTDLISSPSISTERPIPKKGAAEKNIWPRVAPSFCDAVM